MCREVTANRLSFDVLDRLAKTLEVPIAETLSGAAQGASPPKPLWPRVKASSASACRELPSDG
jgi:hypothetical protein